MKSNLNESLVSMILGALTVVLIGVLAYGYFRNHRPNTNQAATTQSEETNQNGELATPSAAVALPTTHTVSSGDTLWSIAEKYYASGYNYQDIAAANQISDPRSLAVGQKLTIPKTEVRQPQTVNTSLEQSVTAN